MISSFFFICEKLIKFYRCFLQILYADTCFTAQALVRLMVDLNEKTLEMMERNRDKQEPRFCDVVAIFKLLSSQLTEARELLEVYMICIY